ncbi:uncharacterized protein RB166_021303 [Leptodactylus fuscus]|uniref:uncharacterized protein LOC142187868 n=1 Tax=Leptodactylus fuscus TaxID=238119 RepID=UPI003F4F1988
MESSLLDDSLDLEDFGETLLETGSLDDLSATPKSLANPKEEVACAARYSPASSLSCSGPPCAQPQRSQAHNVTMSSTASEAGADANDQVEEAPNQVKQESPEALFCGSLAHFLKKVPEELQIRCQTTLLAVLEVFTSNNNPKELYEAVEYYRAPPEEGDRGAPYAPVLHHPPPPPPTPQPPLYIPCDSSQILLPPQDRPMYPTPPPFFPGRPYLGFLNRLPGKGL